MRWSRLSPAPCSSLRRLTLRGSRSTTTSRTTISAACPSSPGNSSACCSPRSALEYVQTWMMQLTGQRIMYDLRMEIYDHLQRLDLRFYDRNPVGRLMTRVTSDVDVLNDLFTAGVVAIFGDVFTLFGIMIVMLGMNWRAGAGQLRRAAADRAGHAVVPPQRPRVLSRRARADRAHQRLSAGEPDRHLDGADLPPRAGELLQVRADQPRPPRRQHPVDLLLCRLLSGYRARRRAGGLDHHLVRWAAGDGR